MSTDTHKVFGGNSYNKPMAYYVPDIFPINPTVGYQVVLRIIGHPRQVEFESTSQITSRVVWVSDDKTEFETQNTYYKPYKGTGWRT